MDIREIRQRVKKIKAVDGDPEAAHSLEDDLYRDFVTDLANSKSVYNQMAKAILKTNDIDFPRWCA